MKIVVADPILAKFSTFLEQTAGVHEWIYAAHDPELPRILETADVLVCSRLRDEDVPATSKLQLVHASGAGIDRISPKVLGPEIALCNTGHHGTSIAEHVMMVATMLNRRTLEADAQMRNGQWRTVATDPDTPFQSTLSGSTIGILGFGEIGQAIARLALAFGMNVVTTRRRPEAPLPDGFETVRVYPQQETDEVLATSDVVVVTIPLSEETVGTINSHSFDVMKKSAFIINVARGGVIDEDALAVALETNQIAGAGMDVWWDAPNGTEAPKVVSRFAKFQNTVLTPHNSGHGRQVFELRAADIARNIDHLDQGEPLERRLR